MNVKPVNCILVKRNIFDKTSGNYIGVIIQSNDHELNKDKTVYYKLLDKKFYTITYNTDHYDFIRHNCIFGVI